MEVKTAKRGRPANKESRLDKAVIIRKTGDMIKSSAQIPSIRKLALEMNVDPMAIYYYFPNKTALLEELSLSLISEIYIPVTTLNWRDNLMRLCDSYLKLLLSYPGLLSIFLSGPAEGPAALFMSRFDAALGANSLSDESRKNISYLIVDYIHGFALADSCHTTEHPLSLELSRGPLNFIFDAMEQQFCGNVV